jgi:hypothetical protein
MPNSKQKKKAKSEHVGHEANGLNAIHTGKGIENTQWAKWKTIGGRGFGAEDANAQADRLRFARVETVGRSNEKDGADRIVHLRHKTTAIQTKYYPTAKDSIEAAFDKQTGLYRYKGMVLEVPKDQYKDAISEMAEKIRADKVPGVYDPQKAELIVKPGDATYEQAKNIAKAGNIDSLRFDIIEQSVASTCALGISFVISFASCKWNGMDTKQALRLSSINAVKSGAITMGAGIITRQFLRTQAGRNFAKFSTKAAKAIVNQIYKTNIGKKAIHKLASAIARKALTGAAAKNVLTRHGRSAWPVTICMTALTTMPDLYQAAIAKKISWSQFIKNLSVNVSGAVGGVGGTVAGAALGSIIPGAGTAIGAIVGGIVGGVAGGIGSSKLASWVAGLICDDDSEQMNCLIQEVIPQLSSDYLVSEEEFVQIQEEMQSLIDVKWIRKMYQAGVKGKSVEDKTMIRAEYAYSELSPIFEKTIAKRTPITIPPYNQIRKDLRKINIRFFIEFLKYKITHLFDKKQLVFEQVE